jgi:glutamyl-tRNA synthetase
VKKHTAEDTRAALLAAAGVISAATQAADDELEERLKKLAAEIGWSGGDLFMAMRVAVTGKTVTPPLIESILLLGRERAGARIRDAADRLKLVAT